MVSTEGLVVTHVIRHSSKGARVSPALAAFVFSRKKAKKAQKEIN